MGRDTVILHLSAKDYALIEEAGRQRFGDFSNLGCTIIQPNGEATVIVNRDCLGGRLTEAADAHELAHADGGSEEDSILAEFRAVGRKGGKAALAEYQAIPRRPTSPEHSQGLRMRCFWRVWQETE